MSLYNYYYSNNLREFEEFLTNGIHPDSEVNNLGFTLLLEICLRTRSGDERYV